MSKFSFDTIREDIYPHVLPVLLKAWC